MSFAETNSIPEGSYILLVLSVKNRKKVLQKVNGERTRLKAYHVPLLVLFISQSRVTEPRRFLYPSPEPVQT